jgi:hypothetical protein
MSDTEQIALRFPPGTRQRLRDLARSGESMTSVLLRAIAALEGGGMDAKPEGSAGYQEQIDALTARLEALEHALKERKTSDR